MRLFFSTFFLGLTFATNALACTCLPIDHYVEQSFDNSSEVFLGIAQSTEVAEEGTIAYRLTRFKVIASFKGVQKKIEVRTHLSSAACGTSFHLRSDLYLVFARTDESGKLHTNLCSSGTVTPDSPHTIRALEQLADL